MPQDRPDVVFASTNFGLLVSHDTGASWFWICEEAVGPAAILYHLGPPPAGRLYAVTLKGLKVSADDGCSWRTASGALDGYSVTDVFPDPSNAARVLAIALLPSGQAGETASAVLQSQDGGYTFGTVLYQAPTGTRIDGVEIAASAPQTIYVSQHRAGDAPDQNIPSLARSTNNGMSFAQITPHPVIDNGVLGIATVDKADANVIYLRLNRPAPQGDALVVSRDGGETIHVGLALDVPMAAFLRQDDKTLRVTTRDADKGFVSTNGGETFARWPNAPRLRALAERNQELWGAGDNYKDLFAVGTSEDGGTTWQPRARFNQICGVSTCARVLAATCEGPWRILQSTFDIPAGICAAFPTGRPDAASAVDAVIPDATPVPQIARGCQCDLRRDTSPAGAMTRPTASADRVPWQHGLVGAALMLFALVWKHFRRKKSGRQKTPG